MVFGNRRLRGGGTPPGLTREGFLFNGIEKDSRSPKIAVITGRHREAIREVP